MDRRKFFGAALVGTAAVFTPLGLSGAMAQGPSNPGGQEPRMTDAELDLVTEKLDSLPPELKNADPQTYPNYEEKLRDALAGQPATEPGKITPLFNPVACGAAIIPFIAENAIPVGRILGWIKDARKIYGGTRAILAAIRRGDAAAEIGEDAATVLGNLLGFNSIITACS